MPIPMVDLKLQHRALQPELDAALAEVLESTQFILGPVGRAFEEEVASYCGVRHAIGVGSGTEALHLALIAAGVGPGDEVITTPFTFIATAEVISYLGAKPVFVDIDADTFNLLPEQVETAVTERTKAVVPVHLFGQPADLEPILATCRRHDLRLVEDCAQSFGARYQGRMTGSWGDLGCFSFFPSKNLGGCGDGGMVITDDDDLAAHLRSLRNHGSRVRYHHHEIGYNSRLDDLQAAVLRVKLKRIDAFNAGRRLNAERYRQRLENSPLRSPVEDGKGVHVFHQYTVLTDVRDQLQAALQKAEIASAVYYPIPLHRQEVYRDACRDVALPVAEATAGRVLSLPIFPELTEEQVDRICRVLLEAL